MKLCDIHQHIVFAVDDGAKTPEMSHAMAKAAVKQGVRDIICTSHISPGSHHTLDLETYYEHIAELQNWLNENKVHLHLHTGSEILYTEKTPALLEAGKVPTLDNTGNVLIEFIPETPYGILKRAAIDVANSGFDPIFAHVERYECLREGDRLEELKSEYGVRLQVNALTVIKNTGLIGGDAWVKKALKKQLIDFIASDAHNIEGRPCRLGDAYEILAKKYSEEYAAQLCCRNPYSLLNTED